MFFFKGVVRVFVIRARDLIKADISLLGKGKSDPFVRIKGIRIVILIVIQWYRFVLIVAQGNTDFKTRVINNTTDPEWNEVCLI